MKLREKDHAAVSAKMSGLSSSRVTLPPVASSMARQSFGGIGRVPVIIWEIKLDETSIFVAKAVRPPATSAALSMALMAILLVVQENIKCCLGLSQALLRAGGGICHTMLTMVKRRNLTDHEKACATRAKGLWLVKKEKERISQIVAGDALGMTDSAFNQYINGKIPLNTDIVARMANYFGVSPRAIDPLWLNVGSESMETELLDMLNDYSRAEFLANLQKVAAKTPPADALKIARYFLDRAATGS
jgi:plasmid maintenance system antidote protein VapI